MDTIRVVNGLDRPLTGRYAAVDYTFPPGKPVDIPPDAARHIFAFGQSANADKTRALNGLGLLGPLDNFKEAVKLLTKIKFLEGRVVFEDEPEEPQTENGRARVNLGGEGEATRKPASPITPGRMPANSLPR
jgi:hypothetical protein